MPPFKSALIFFFFAVLFVVAKPFLGFTFFSRQHPPSAESIFVKAFTKRSLEYSENSSLNASNIQKKLADPGFPMVLTFAFFLSVLFPLVFGLRTGMGRSPFQVFRFCVLPARRSYLLNSKLII